MQSDSQRLESCRVLNVVRAQVKQHILILANMASANREKLMISTQFRCAISVTVGLMGTFN